MMQHLSTAGLRLHHVHSVPSHEADHEEDILRSHGVSLHQEVFERVLNYTSHPPSGTLTAKCPSARCPSHQGLSNPTGIMQPCATLVQETVCRAMATFDKNKDKPEKRTGKFPRRIAASMHGRMNGGHIPCRCLFMRVIYVMFALGTHPSQCYHLQPFLKESFQLGQLVLQFFLQYLRILFKGQCPSNLLTTGLVIGRQASGGT